MKSSWRSTRFKIAIYENSILPRRKRLPTGRVQNIGASPEPADADSWQNFGTGAFLLAGSEILKLEK